MDCFVVGSRGMDFQPLAQSQVELVQWLLLHIEQVLKKPPQHGWMGTWLELLKTEGKKGFHPEIPRFGFGDPTSCGIMEYAVRKTHACGAVRHGAECFNF